MYRKPDSHSYEMDRLRRIVESIVDRPQMSLRKLAEQLGLDQATKEGRTAYQAINRWYGGRESKDSERPGELTHRRLKKSLRVKLFNYVRTVNRDEYERPLQGEEHWLFREEEERWAFDRRQGDRQERDRAALEEFVRYLQKGAVVTKVTRDSISAELSVLGGNSTKIAYRPAGGLLVEDYDRLVQYADVPDTAEELALGVVENLLWCKGLLSSEIRLALFKLRRSGDSLTELLEHATFEEIAEALAEDVRQAQE